MFYYVWFNGNAWLIRLFARRFQRMPGEGNLVYSVYEKYYQRIYGLDCVQGAHHFLFSNFLSNTTKFSFPATFQAFWTSNEIKSKSKPKEVGALNGWFLGSAGSSGARLLLVSPHSPQKICLSLGTSLELALTEKCSRFLFNQSSQQGVHRNTKQDAAIKILEIVDVIEQPCQFTFRMRKQRSSSKLIF
jgi:hypothetical protein